MQIFSPRFWQFYAKGVIWAGFLLLPFWLLMNYLQQKNVVIPVISDAFENFFSLGYVVVNAICGYSQICLTEGMSVWEASAFAYFITILIFGFIIGIYKSWTWSSVKNQPIKEEDTDNNFDF